MELVNIYNKSFEKIDFSENCLTPGEYEHCQFIDCVFANGSLASNRFSNCTFISCNLSSTKLAHTAFIDVVFKDCKMLGLHYEHCDRFGFSVSYTNCILNYSSFNKLKIKKTHFKNCKLEGVDFGECDLSQVVFEHCDLLKAVFEQTLLEGADFRTASNFSIDPECNRMKKAKFTLEGLTGLLTKYQLMVEE